MSPQVELLSCREAQELVPLFVDGELDAARMRAVALHGAQCALCDGEIRQLERLQLVLRDHIEQRLAVVASEDLWKRIESKLRKPPLPWWRRLHEAAAAWRWQPQVLWPAFAVFAIAALATALYLRTNAPVGTTGGTMVAGAEPPAWIDSLEADVGSVAVIDDLQNHTTVLWVSDELPLAGGNDR